MLRIVGRKIILTRGDSAELSIKVIKKDGSLYTMNPSDKLILTIKKHTLDNTPLLQKEVVGTTVIMLNPEDTKTLEFGRHVYDVQLTAHNGSIYTVVPSSEFVIAEEVTM